MNIEEVTKKIADRLFTDDRVNCVPVEYKDGTRSSVFLRLFTNARGGYTLVSEPNEN